MEALAKKISDLTDRANNRERGRMLARKVREDLGSETLSEIELGLDGAGLVSRSFLDGVVLESRELGILDKLTFRTNNEDSIGKLSRISRHRGLDLFVRRREGDVRERVAPANPAVIEFEDGSSVEPL